MTIYDASLIGKKQSVVDEIILLNPLQTPLINMLGFSDPVTQTNHQWFEDVMFGNEAKVAGQVETGTTEIVVTDVEPFRAGQVVKAGEELLLVKSVNTGEKKLTVVRGYAGTEAAVIKDKATIEVQFVEGAEGADARQSRHKPRVARSNNTQIFDDTIDISGTAMAVTQYGIKDQYEYEKQKKQLELALQLEKALIGGIGYTKDQVRQMKGLRSFITTNVTDAQNEAISAKLINDAAQAIYEKGGFATGGDYAILVGAKQKRALSELDANKVYITRGDNVRGQTVDKFVTDFGEFEIGLNNNLNADELIIVDKNRMKIRPLQGRDFFHKYMGEQGDYTRGILVGEYTLELTQEQAFARIKGLK